MRRLVEAERWRVIAFDPHGSGRNKAAAAVKRLALPMAG